MPKRSMFMLVIDVILGGHREKICMDDAVLVQIAGMVMLVKDVLVQSG